MGGLSILYTLHNGATLFTAAQGAAVPHWDKWYAGKTFVSKMSRARGCIFIICSCFQIIVEVVNNQFNGTYHAQIC